MVDYSNKKITDATHPLFLLSQSLTDEICPYGHEARGRVGGNKSPPTRLLVKSFN